MSKKEGCTRQQIARIRNLHLIPLYPSSVSTPAIDTTLNVFQKLSNTAYVALALFIGLILPVLSCYDYPPFIRSLLIAEATVLAATTAVKASCLSLADIFGIYQALSRIESTSKESTKQSSGDLGNEQFESDSDDVPLSRPGRSSRIAGTKRSRVNDDEDDEEQEPEPEGKKPKKSGSGDAGDGDDQEDEDDSIAVAASKTSKPAKKTATRKRKQAPGTQVLDLAEAKVSFHTLLHSHASTFTRFHIHTRSHHSPPSLIHPRPSFTLLHSFILLLHSHSSIHTLSSY